MPEGPKSPSSNSIKTIPEIMREMLHKRMSSAFAGLGKAVIPIYRGDPRPEREGRAQHVGTGVLLKRSDGHFLITAAHVIDHIKISQLYLPSQRRLHRVEGSGIVTVAPKGKRDADRFDFAVIELAGGTVKGLGEVRYLSEGEFGAPEIDVSGHSLMALGFPVSKNKKIDHIKQKIRPKRSSYGAKALTDDEFARKIGVSGADHLFVKYERRSRDASGAVVDSFSPKGMSGGALIDLGAIGSLSALQQGETPFHVVGIIIEYYKFEKRLVSIKTEVILDAL
jgi:Trypsin-like peptidase domain